MRIATMMPVLILLVLFIPTGAFGADLTMKDLKGFHWASNILALKDVKLPAPQPPEEGGIDTGAVFILGRYLPPPYQVTVEGPHVLINGVPATYLKRLTETEEDRQETRRSEALAPVRKRLIDAWQHAKWYEKRELNRSELQQMLAATHQMFAVQAVTKRQHEGQQVVSVTLHHPEFDDCDLEIDSSDVLHRWIRTSGMRMIGEQNLALLKAHPEDDQRVKRELIAYAERQPWVKTFELPPMQVPTQNRQFSHYRINGEYYRVPLLNEDRRATTLDEREQHEHERAVNRHMPRIRSALERDHALFFPGSGGWVYRNSPGLLRSIQTIMEEDIPLLAKRDLVAAALVQLGCVSSKPSANELAEYIAALWSEL